MGVFVVLLKDIPNTFYKLIMAILQNDFISVAFALSLSIPFLIYYFCSANSHPSTMFQMK